jgi:hypothetical protein
LEAELVLPANAVGEHGLLILCGNQTQALLKNPRSQKRDLGHPPVCFEAGRLTLTQSSWTMPTRRRSRKWMSGHAATALVLPSDRGQFRTLTICSRGEPIPTGQGESPFPLDFYLSWISTKPSRNLSTKPEVKVCRAYGARTMLGNRCPSPGRAGLTFGGRPYGPRSPDRFLEKHFQDGPSELQIPRLRSG